MPKLLAKPRFCMAIPTAVRLQIRQRASFLCEFYFIPVSKYGIIILSGVTMDVELLVLRKWEEQL